jgi:hypothetical protein
VLDVLNAYTHWTSVYRLIRRTLSSNYCCSTALVREESNDNNNGNVLFCNIVLVYMIDVNVLCPAAIAVRLAANLITELKMIQINRTKFLSPYGSFSNFVIFWSHVSL